VKRYKIKIISSNNNELWFTKYKTFDVSESNVRIFNRLNHVTSCINTSSCFTWQNNNTNIIIIEEEVVVLYKKETTYVKR